MGHRHEAGEDIRATDHSCFSLTMPSSKPPKDSADGSGPGEPICHGMEPWSSLLAQFTYSSLLYGRSDSAISLYFFDLLKSLSSKNELRASSGFLSMVNRSVIHCAVESRVIVARASGLQGIE